MPHLAVLAAEAQGRLRQKRAAERRAQLRYEEEYPYQAEDQHVENALFECGVCMALGLKWPKRLDTDHQLARFELPDKTGVWCREPPMYSNPWLKVRPDDFGIIISGRSHGRVTVPQSYHCKTPDGRDLAGQRIYTGANLVNGVDCCVVEVRAWAYAKTIQQNYPVEDRGQRGAQAYLIPWDRKDIRPIEDLIAQFHLSIPPTTRHSPPSCISRLIHFGPDEQPN